MNFKKIIIAGLVATTFTSFFFAQTENSDKNQADVRILTVDEAVSLALENNLQIKQSAMDLEILALKNKYSWNSASPSFNLSVGANGSNSTTFVDNPVDSSSLGWSISGGVSLTLTPALATSIKAAKLAYEAGENSLETTKRNIELQVRKTFYSLLYFNENLELQKRNLETVKQNYESNLRKYNQGRLDELNLLKSQYNYESKIPTIETLKSTYETNLNNFKMVLGVDLSEELELTGSLEEALNVSLDESILQQDVEEIPSIKTTKKSIETAINAYAASKYSAYGPTITFSVNDNISKSDRTVSGIKAKGDVGNNLSYSANVRIPLDGYLPWSNSKISMTSQEESIEKMKQSLEDAKVKARLSIKNTYSQIAQAKIQLQLNEKNVELAQKTYDMTKKAYDVGSSDLLSLQTAEDNLMQAKYSVTNQKYQIISSILDLENTLGLPFGALNKRVVSENN